ncbi:heavy metal-associated isoprenylated plant protein 34 [Vigna radiata var. radiata]|uniref:Heavy metal-associated isoprenylated plant protein 34 n=1 Tax=Vigna radiata var. radiata TaxID=3916 RepID=A0A1S3VFN8_VIGRR|nr:heavy metal-associated isoprenylated plant protein 34 [Vigna radiata var. radiata]
MSKQDLLKIQTCVLKVNIDCDGCAHKVKKILQKIDGVYSVKIDAGGGKVVVAGDVDPEKLVKKIKMGGKHAEIWGGQNGNHQINPKFQNLQVDNNKVGRDIKSQNQKGQKGGDGGGGGKGQMAHFTNMKGVQDLKEPVKEQKSVRFNLPEKEFEASDDGFDEYEDSLDDYDDEEEEEEEVIGHGHGHGHGNPMHHNKMMPKMGDGGGPHGPAGVMNGPATNNGHKDNAGGSRNNNGSDKKGGDIDQAMLIKGKGGNYNEAKDDDNEGKKSSQKGKKKKKDEIKKKDGGLLGRFLSFGRKSKKVGLEEVTYSSNSKNQSNESGNKKEKEGKMKEHSNGKNDFDFLDYDKTPLLHKNGKVGQMDPSQKGYQALQGDAMGHQGMQMQHVPYNNLQQQQYMAMMMNQPQHQHQHHYQHETNMNSMYPTNMMYGRPYPSMNYMAPPPMPSHPMADPITHTFSDENVESCRIM